MLKAMVREPSPEEASKRIQVGDLVIFRLGEYEKRLVEVAFPAQSTLQWSAPHWVTEVKDKVLVCVPVGCGVHPQPRQVPLAICRKMRTETPETLLNLNAREIDVIAPSYKPWASRHHPMRPVPYRVVQQLLDLPSMTPTFPQATRTEDDLMGL